MDPRKFETKRIGHTTYIFCQKINVLAEIKGPYRPGDVWKAELYKTNAAFEQAWKIDKVTAVQRERITKEQDQAIAAMTWGQSNGVDPQLYTENLCLGYQYKTKTLAVEAAMKVLEVQLWV